MYKASLISEFEKFYKGKGTVKQRIDHEGLERIIGITVSLT
jgi:hypothetical protein